MDHAIVKRAMARALIGGAKRTSLSKAEWTVSGDCTDPVFIDLQSAPREDASGAFTGTSLHLEVWARCKRCDACLRARSTHWALRAEHECRQSIRTWFGTLTLSPEQQHRAYATACAEFKASGDFDGLDYRAQFSRRVRVINRDITLYVKRVRKLSGAKLRILFVAEHHKSGLPHFHTLIHEHDLIGVSEEMLRREWKLGFTKWELISSQAGAARYVCKYLSKSGASRLRASLGYGKTSLDIAAAFNAVRVHPNDHIPSALSSRTNGAGPLGGSEASVAQNGLHNAAAPLAD